MDIYPSCEASSKPTAPGLIYKRYPLRRSRNRSPPPPTAHLIISHHRTFHRQLRWGEGLEEEKGSPHRRIRYCKIQSSTPREPSSSRTQDARYQPVPRGQGREPGAYLAVPISAGRPRRFPLGACYASRCPCSASRTLFRDFFPPFLAWHLLRTPEPGRLVDARA